MNGQRPPARIEWPAAPVPPSTPANRVEWMERAEELRAFHDAIELALAAHDDEKARLREYRAMAYAQWHKGTPMSLEDLSEVAGRRRQWMVDTVKSGRWALLR